MSDILGYARVSTASQDLEGQRRRLQEAGAVRVFEDTVSGKQFERPGLEKLLDYARPGDTVVIVRLDRLGRSLRELLDLVQDFGKRGLALQSLEERIDTTSAGGQLVMHLFAALAEFERNLIGARTRDGMAAARARGSRVGRPPRDPDKIAAAIILAESGMTRKAAAEAVGISRTVFFEALRDREALRAEMSAAGQAERQGAALKARDDRRATAGRSIDPIRPEGDAAEPV